MKTTHKEVRNIFNFSISTWINFLIGFFSTFILTRIFLPDVLGVINLFYTTVTTLMSVFTFGLDSSLIRFFYQLPGQEKLSNFIFKLLIPCLASTFIIGVISLLFFGDIVSGFFLGKKESILCLFLLIGVWNQILLRYLNIIYRMESKVTLYNIQSVVVNIVTKLSVILGAIVDSSSAEFAIFFNVLTISFVSLYYMYAQKKEWMPQKHFSCYYSCYREVFSFAFFGWITMFVTQALVLSSQLIINNTLSLNEVGIYTGASIFTAVLTVARSGFCTYWSAFMYKNYDNNEKRIFILKMHDIIVFCCLFCCTILFSFRSIIYLFIGEEFRESKSFFSLLLLFPLLQTIQETTGYGISIKQKNYILTYIMLVSLLLNVFFGIVLIDIMGLIGVAWSSFFVAIFSFSLSTFYGQKLYISIFNIKRSIFGVCLLLIESVLPVFIHNDWLLSLLLLIVFLLSCCLYSDIIQNIKKMLYKKKF